MLDPESIRDSKVQINSRDSGFRCFFFAFCVIDLHGFIPNCITVQWCLQKRQYKMLCKSSRLCTQKRCDLWQKAPSSPAVTGSRGSLGGYSTALCLALEYRRKIKQGIGEEILDDSVPLLSSQASRCIATYSQNPVTALKAFCP